MSFATRLAQNDEQEAAIRKIESWVKKSGLRIVGGTQIGKYYDTVILDLTHNGSEIYIHSNGFEDTDHGYPGVTVYNEPVKNYTDFKNAIQDLSKLNKRFTLSF